MPRSRVLAGILIFAVGIAVGGYLFHDSQPRSFLAVSRCESCYRPSDLAGLLASAGIQRAGAALPLVVKETDRCIAIEHPFRKMRFHFVVFPKKDVKSIADISVDNQQHILDCLAIIQALVIENGLRSYRVETNGPGLPHVTYLHFHLLSKEGHAQPSAAKDAPSASELRR